MCKAQVEGYLFEHGVPGHRPDRFIAIMRSASEARLAVDRYVGKSVETRLIRQGANVLGKGRELGVTDGHVIQLL